MANQSGFIFLLPLIFFAALISFTYLFLAQPYKVSGESMNPTLVNGEYILTKKFDKDFAKGNIVVFKDPKNEDHDFIKRIIGLPGDKVMIQENKIYINGRRIEEPYLTDDTTEPNDFLASNKEMIVPENNYFMLGDNRAHSSDSRVYGFIPKEKIESKYWFTYYKP